MEHDKQFLAPCNPVGVGPYFGRTTKSGLKCDKLSVAWCDKKKLPVKQTLTWLCPPINPEKGLRVKDPETGEYVLIFILGYVKRGVKLLVQDIPENKKKAPAKTATAKTAPASPKKRKAPPPKKNIRKKKSNAKTKEQQTPTKTPPKKKSRPKNNNKGKRTPAKKTHWRERSPAPENRMVTRYHRRKHTSVRRKLDSAAEDDEDTSEDTSGVDADIRWKRFRRPELAPAQHLRLQNEVEQRGQLGDYSLAQWLCFVDRVAREYCHLHKKLYKNDAMHLRREVVLKSAIAVVASQVQPKSLRPAKSHMPELLETVQPILEIALDLVGPKANEKKYSRGWIAEKIKSGKITYADCAAFPELMDAKVTKCIADAMAAGSEDGLIMLKPGEKPVGPDEIYVLSSSRVGRRRATASDCGCCPVFCKA